MVNKYIVNVNNDIDSKFADYIRTSNNLGDYGKVLKAIVPYYKSDSELYAVYKTVYRFCRELGYENINVILLIMLCDCVLYDKAITEQLNNMYTFFNQIPYSYKIEIIQKLLSRYNMISVKDTYIDIGKMLPDKDYISSSFMTRFELDCDKHNELILKDDMLRFKKLRDDSDKVVMYGDDLLGYTDVIMLYNRKLTYLFINKKDVEFRQIRFNKDIGYTHSTIDKDKIDKIDTRVFGKVMFT